MRSREIFMKPQLKMELSLAMLMALLSACSPMAAYAEVPPPTPAPTFAADVEPDAADQKVEALSNEESEAQDVPTVDVIEQLAEAYLNGEVDNVGYLSEQEFVKLSAKLAEEKNEARGINPIILNNEYVDPDDLTLKDYDGHPDMNETIQMYVPIAGKDEQGNLQFEVNGQIVTIPGSANVDWNMVISDPNDTRIDWPKTKPMKETGVPEAQSKVDLFGMVLNPMVFLDKKVGELKLGGSVGQNLDPLSTLPFYDIETDAVGNPVLARMILTLGFDYNLFEEGGTLDAQSFDGQLPEDSYVYQGLQENAVYHVGLNPKQKKTYEDFGYSLDSYRGIADGNKVQELITEQETNDKDMIVTFVSLLIRKTTTTAK